MDEKIDIYCEFGFLKTFCETQNNKIWWNYYDLLCGSSSRILFIDAKEKKFYDYLDKNANESTMLFLTELLDSKYNGTNKQLEFNPKEGEYMKEYIQDDDGEEYFHSKDQVIFLMDREINECKKMEKDYGLLFISKKNFKDYNLLFSADMQDINEKSDLWECVKDYRLPCNRIILVDNFIMTEEIDKIEENLHSLFNALLPLELNKMKFFIDIFTKKPDNRDERVEEKKEKIKKCIKNLRLYEIEPEIHIEHEPEDHDRYLLTNYGLFTCGYGFVLTELQRRKGTTLNFFPITHCSISKKNDVYLRAQIIRDKKLNKLKTKQL